MRGTQVGPGPRSGRIDKADVGDGRDALHEEYLKTKDPLLRSSLVQAHAGLARAAARRFENRGPSIEDLTQVAYVALLKAIEGFDPRRGLRFSTYAMPTMLGELKRYLRDYSWGVRPPRRVHDLYLQVERAVDELTQALGRSPTIAEIADDLDVDKERVLEAMDAVRGRRLTSLELPLTCGGTLSDSVGTPDRGIADVERTMTVDALLEKLPEDEQRVVCMRFRNRMTQAEIAAALGRSQMQVSRVLARSLDRLRLLAEPAGDVQFDR